MTTAIESTTTLARFDRLGIAASAACTVHCLAAPLVLLALPALGEVWAHPATHVAMAFVVVPLALTVLLRGTRIHRKRWVAAAAIAGALTIGVGTALPYLSGGEGDTAAAASIDTIDTDESPATEHTASTCSHCCPSIETDATGESRWHIPAATVVTFLGSMLLIAAHVGNLVGCCRRG